MSPPRDLPLKSRNERTTILYTDALDTLGRPQGPSIVGATLDFPRVPDLLWTSLGAPERTKGVGGKENATRSTGNMCSASGAGYLGFPFSCWLSETTGQPFPHWSRAAHPNKGSVKLVSSFWWRAATKTIKTFIDRLSLFFTRTQLTDLVEATTRTCEK